MKVKSESQSNNNLKFSSNPFTIQQEKTNPIKSKWFWSTPSILNFLKKTSQPVKKQQPHQTSNQNCILVPSATSNLMKQENFVHPLWIYFYKLTPYGPLIDLVHHPPPTEPYVWYRDFGYQQKTTRINKKTFNYHSFVAC